MATDNRHPETVLMVLALAAALGIALMMQPDPPPVRQAIGTQPAPATWEIRAWESSHCDRCGKGLTRDPQDGAYIIGGKSFWLHKGCVAPVVKAARR